MKSDDALCLTDLLDRNVSAFEFFQTLAPELQSQLRQEDTVSTFEELQARAARERGR